MIYQFGERPESFEFRSLVGHDRRIEMAARLAKGSKLADVYSAAKDMMDSGDLPNLLGDRNQRR